MADILDAALAPSNSSDELIVPPLVTSTEPTEPIPEPVVAAPTPTPTASPEPTPLAPPSSDEPVKSKKKFPGVGILVVLLLLLFALPVGVYYISQQQSLNDIRNRAMDACEVECRAENPGKPASYCKAECGNATPTAKDTPKDGGGLEGSSCSTTSCANGYDCINNKCKASTKTDCKKGDNGAPVCCTDNACTGGTKVCEGKNRLECKIGNVHCTIDGNGCTDAKPPEDKNTPTPIPPTPTPIPPTPTPKCNPLWYCKIGTGCIQTASNYSATMIECGNSTNTCQANLALYVPGTTGACFATQASCNSACSVTSTPTRSPTPTKSPTPTATPTPQVGCDYSCTVSSDCSSGLVCSGSRCRNNSCAEQASCQCPGTTATPTPTPTMTATPTPSPIVYAGCNSACTVNTDCSAGLVCLDSSCRNPSCTEKTTCQCDIAYVPPTPQTPVAGAGPSVLGASVIAGGFFLLLLGLAL